ncbi:hypothetical protein [Agromyces ramosus]|uniref:Zn-dependent protease with chaperone function n=1 Tax=Agromyces ramosus TaxID=33879 RepID=A0ABU0RB35_9MICO|nr:hypothetical protein [Agromyces ramosus]MDQ0894416.1 Zn-dependent protease with chaperone function [Agromyces ramosus]
MSKLGDALQNGKIVGWTVIGAIVVTGGGLGAVALTSANASPAAVVVVETAEPIDYTTLPASYGVAAEQEADAAAAVAAEQARIAEAAAAEAARIAAEQAAAAEAQRVADEQAAAQVADEADPEDPGTPDPGPSGLPSGAVPPNVAGTDQPDSTACASSTLTWDGTQSVCA